MSTRWQACLALALCACAPEPAVPAFALEDVVAPAIAALEAELARDVQGGEIAEPGEPSVAVLAAILADPRTADAARAAAIDGLVALDSPLAAGHVATQVERAPQAWLRAHAARALARTHQDQLVPRLVLCLEHESDPSSVIELATALAHFGNLAGLDGVLVLRQSASSEIAAAARERLAELAARAGVPDGHALWRLWNVDDPDGRLQSASPSTRHRLEVWRCIARLAAPDERAVDDARFVLAHASGWVVDPLCRALHDADASTRIRAAQCLQGMGARATRAGPALLAALGEPRLAPAAALALGFVAYPACAPELARRVERGFAPELRVAAAQALGPLNLPSGVEPLVRALAADEPLELRQAAAQSLLMLEPNAAALQLLVECLTLPGADASAAEAALEAWISKLETPAAQDVRARWNALAGAPHTTLDAAALRERQRARAELIGPALARLVP